MFSSFGFKIEVLQSEHGFTNVQLAEKIGIKPQNIPKLKRVEKPRKTTVKKLANAFGVPVRSFFDKN